MTDKSKSVGRYAPSPTGELHLGNLRTALVAWLYARLQKGLFLLRMEDLDTPRIVPGSDTRILRDLELLGLDWDGEVLYQSNRIDAYQQALDGLERQGLIYPCYCSRKDIQQAASAPHVRQGVYPGTCRNLTINQRQARQQNKAPAVRLRVEQALEAECGDVVVRRADGLFAYQLAVVVDDIAQGVNQVVRGADLKTSVARQDYLAKILSSREWAIRYLHAPLLCDDAGQRLSKRDGSQSLSQWCDAGGSVESLIGYFANSLSLQSEPTPITVQALLSNLTLEELEQCLD